MSIALFALAAVMIVGGIVSVIQGFPFVRLESGLAMTIAGATTASAGAVVLGLAVLARRLRGLERALSAAPTIRVPHPEADVGPSLEPEPAAPARQRPSLAATAASLGGLGGAGLGAAAMRGGREPTFFDPTPPPPAPTDSAAIEPLLPNLLPEDEAPAVVPPSEPAIDTGPVPPAQDEMLFATHEPSVPEVLPVKEVLPVEEVPHVQDVPHGDIVHFAEPPHPAEPEAPSSPEPEQVTLRPTLVEPAEFVELPAAAPEPAPEPPPVEEAPYTEAEPQVVGTYASGGNTYVMYSTGVIEAETPRGRYTFASLDELKAFVEAGGETDARGAA